MDGFRKDIQYYKFCAYGFLKNLRFFEPFLILFFLEGDLSYLQIGMIYTIREVIRNIFEIPSGLAADVLGRRRTMITSFSLYIISFLIYSYQKKPRSLFQGNTEIFFKTRKFTALSHGRFGIFLREKSKSLQRDIIISMKA